MVKFKNSFENFQLVKIFIKSQILEHDGNETYAMRMRRKLSYLNDYILSIDFRRYRIKKNIIVPKPLKIYPPNSLDYDELKGYMIHLIRMKMDHSTQRYFSLNLVLATTGYLNFLFNKFSHRKRTRTMKMRINSLKYYVNTQPWRFLVASDFIDLMDI